MIVAGASSKRDLRAAAGTDNGRIRRRAAAMGDEGVRLRPALESALADQVDKRLAEEENGLGHKVER
jgi:hypothetical protein